MVVKKQQGNVSGMKRDINPPYHHSTFSLLKGILHNYFHCLVVNEKKVKKRSLDPFNYMPKRHRLQPTKIW